MSEPKGEGGSEGVIFPLGIHLVCMNVNTCSMYMINKCQDTPSNIQRNSTQFNDT